MEAAKKIPFHKHQFKVITYEHDNYRGALSKGLKEGAVRFFERLGYLKVPEHICDNFHPETDRTESWWINPSFIDVRSFLSFDTEKFNKI